MRIRNLQISTVLAAAALVAAPFALAADDNQTASQDQGQAVITVLPGSEVPGGIPQGALQVKVDGKNSTVTGWTALHSPDSQLQVVILIDDGARESLSLQLNDIGHFIQGLPPNARVAVAYMEYGRAALAGPLTTDHAAAVRELHMPIQGMPGVSASPYFCLSNLANHWPSTDAHARREVVMVTDGVDYYEVRYDPEDPYVQAAIRDSVRAHLVVYSIYWRNQGFLGRTGYADYDGQNLLAQLTAATGGNSYWEGYGNPVTLAPYLDDIDRRIHNQYELDFMSPTGSRPQMASLRLKVAAHAKVAAPQQVYVHPGAE
jgi:hypothetical protein